MSSGVVMGACLAETLEHCAGSLALEPVVSLGRSLGFQILEDGLGIIAVDIGLCHQREGNAMVDAAEFGDLLIGAGLLAGKLVAREADDHQPLVLVLLIEGLQTVVLRSEAALGSGVDNHEDFAFELREVYLGFLVAAGLEIIDLCHSCVFLSFIYIVHDANIRLSFYIASDILETVTKKAKIGE